MAAPTLADILAGKSDAHRVLHSPGGTRYIVLNAIEAFNSQWVENGTLYRTSDNAILAQFGEWQWHVDRAVWNGEDRVELQLRRYPGDAPGLVLRVDLATRLAHTSTDDKTVPLDELTGWLELWYQINRQRR